MRDEVLNQRKTETFTVSLVKFSRIKIDGRVKGGIRPWGAPQFKVSVEINALGVSMMVAGPYDNVVTAESVYVQTLRKLRGEPEEN